MNDKTYVKVDAKKAAVTAALKGILEGKKGRWLYSYALKVSGNMADAEDLVQEACFRALLAWQRLDAEHDLVNWLARVVWNRHIDTLRRRKVRPTMDVWREEPGGTLQVFGGVADGSPALDTGLLRREERAQLLRALARLSPRERELVVRCDINAESYQAAADALGVPVGTVKSRLSRARVSLRKLVTK